MQQFSIGAETPNQKIKKQDISEQDKERFKTDEVKAIIRFTDNGEELTPDINLKDFTLENKKYTPNEGIIGSVSAKRLTSNIYNEDNSIDIENREVELLMGINTDPSAPLVNNPDEKKTTEKANVLRIQDSADYYGKLKVYGSHSQKTTEGRNLFKIKDYTKLDTWSNGGATIVKTSDSITVTTANKIYSGFFMNKTRMAEYTKGADTTKKYVISADIEISDSCLLKFRMGRQ